MCSDAASGGLREFFTLPSTCRNSSVPTEQQENESYAFFPQFDIYAESPFLRGEVVSDGSTDDKPLIEATVLQHLMFFFSCGLMHTLHNVGEDPT